MQHLYKTYLLILLMTFSPAAIAQDGPIVQSAPVLPVEIVPEGAVITGGEGIYEIGQEPKIVIGPQDQVIVEETVCKYMVEYQPMQGVEYQPGVDVNGKAVVPADIQTTQITPPSVIEFNIAIDVAEYVGIPRQPGIENFANIGTIQVKNNQLYFNGEPLKPDSEKALLALCQTDEDIINEPSTGETE